MRHFYAYVCGMTDVLPVTPSGRSYASVGGSRSVDMTGVPGGTSVRLNEWVSTNGHIGIVSYTVIDSSIRPSRALCRFRAEGILPDAPRSTRSFSRLPDIHGHRIKEKETTIQVILFR